ncbi:hypothetical protein [Sphingomonas mesophila]|uniref:hypothetical protein n=1 Tax=Sphingomonas mesophila TaxID=2303576 RepID=UPI0013C2DB13|nr:hypothetical protein [Sphingomonas mesophila]
MNGMPVTEMILGMTAGCLLLIGAIQILRLIQTWITHKTIRRTIDKDPSLAVGMLARLGEPGSSAGDDRTGVVLIAIGLAMIGATVLVGDATWLRYGLGAALFPLLVGGALWLRQSLAERAAQRAAGE